MPFNPAATAEEVGTGFDPNKPAEEITPTGLPSINETTGPSAPQSSDLSEFSAGLSNPAAIPKITAPEASALYTPTLKYGGATAAGIAALPEAAATGPFAPALEAGAVTAGYAGGASLAQQLDQIIGLSEPPKSISEVASRTAENVRKGIEYSTLGPIIGGGTTAALETAGEGVATAIGKGPAMLRKVSEAAARIGINLTPAELTGSRALSLLENALSYLPWTSGIIQKYQLGELEKMTNKVNDLIDSSGSSRDIEEQTYKLKNSLDDYMQKNARVNKQASVAMKDRLLQKLGSNISYSDLDSSAQEIVQRGLQNRLTQNDSVYQGVAAKMPDDTIVPENLINTAKDIVARREGLAGAKTPVYGFAKFYTEPVSGTPEEINMNPATASDAQKQIQQIYLQASPSAKAAMLAQNPELANLEQPGYTPKTYQQLKDQVAVFNNHKFSQVSTAGGGYESTQDGHDLNAMIQAAKKDMAQLAENSGNPDIIQAHKNADVIYQNNLAYMKDPAFKKINDMQPGSVTYSILNSKNPQLIERYHAMVGDDLFNKAKARMTNDILGLNEDDVFNGDDIRKFITNLGESAVHIYNTDELNYFKDIANAIDLKEGATQNLLNNPFVKKVFGKGKFVDGEFVSPERIVPPGIASSLVMPQNTGSAPAVENVFGKKAKEDIANAFLPQLLAENQRGWFKPAVFSTQFNKYGYDTLKSWYGTEMADKLQDIALTGSQFGAAERLAGNPSGTAKNLIAVFEARRILNDVANEAIQETPRALFTLGKETAFILGPRELAKLYVNPSARNLFIDGLSTTATAKAGRAIAAKLLPMINDQLQPSEKIMEAVSR